jgi:hypothetical protein
MEFINEAPHFLKYLITGLGAMLAVLGLFVDKNGRHFRTIAPLFILLVIVLGVFQAADAINSDKDSTVAKEQRDKLLVLVDNSSIAS